MRPNVRTRSLNNYSFLREPARKDDGEPCRAAPRDDEISIVAIFGKNCEARAAITYRESRIINRAERDTHL